MFEKEAEEIANKRCHEIMCYGHCSFSSSKHHRCGEWHREYNCAKEGIEFGYNKANEWHYVKDRDLPKAENLECLCIIRPMKEEGEPFESKNFRGVLYFRNGRFYLDEDNGNDYLKETNSDFTDLVIAWKEIVLPKEGE
ncbi:MAG: hypothetical protein J6W60_04600 [Treponema sp.]|nr:hypothetical protein [Treponema sp.]